MQKSNLERYTLALCFVSLIMLIVALCISIYSVLRVAAPEFTMSPSQFAEFQSNDAFWDVCIQDRTCSDVDEERPAEETLTKLRQNWYERAASVEQRTGAQWFVKALITSLITAIVFVTHWMLARRMRTAKPATEEESDTEKAEQSEKKNK